jgi:hypothetical protein
MKIGDLTVTITAVDEFTGALQRVNDVLCKTATSLIDLLREFREDDLRCRRRKTSGHRHEGTVSWALRYAPARRDVPLGQRTEAKRRALR